MKVSELARRADTSATAIRFYEAAGILPAPRRARNGYRIYEEGDVRRTQVVVSLRKLGLDLPQAGRLARLCASGRCDAMTGLLTEDLPRRRHAVADAMAELRQLDAELAALERALACGQPHPTLCLDVENTRP